MTEKAKNKQKETLSRQTKVFRVEILKPSNYTWQDFGAIISKSTYDSAQLANEVMTKRFLLSKKEINRGSSTFCSMIGKCKTARLSSVSKCAVCHQAQLKYQALAKKLLRADISLPTFKNNVLYVGSRGVEFTRLGEGDWSVRLSLLPKGFGEQPEVILKTDEMKSKSPGYYQILERIVGGDYVLGSCQLIKDKLRNKIYLLASYSFIPDKASSPIPTRIIGVDLGVATPAYCALNDSVKRLSLNMEGQKLLRVKRQIQGRRRGVVREITGREKRRGHGLSGKFYPMRELEQKWINFRQTWNHTLSSRVVEFAIREQASVIHIEDLSVDGVPQFLGKDWPVAELLQMITYKGEEAGLRVERVDPYKTSQICSRCGTIKENFSLKDRVKNGMPVFVCDACGFQDNADYNGAKNIARSTVIVKQHINNKITSHGGACVKPKGK